MKIRVKYKNGKYIVKYRNEKDKKGEIDIVVEASDTLIFFEIKTKALTRRSRCGSDINLFFDLLESLLESQIQANNHEIFIRKNGSIRFIEEENLEVNFNNKEIAKVSVTLLDYGSFQDRAFILQFLQSLLLGELEFNNGKIHNKDTKKKIEILEKKVYEFKEQYNELIKLAPEKTNDPFFYCWFLSLPQLLILLDHVNSSEDLKRELWQTRNFSTGSMDFYKEYNYIQELKKNK